jgi:hypothetical protein
MPVVLRRPQSRRGLARLARARRLLNAAAMRLFDTLWEPLAVTLIGIVLFAASL